MMSGSSNSTSPLTGRLAERYGFGSRDITRYNESIGSWAATDVVLRDGFEQGKSYVTDALKLDERETRRLLAYVQSLVWEARVHRRKLPLFVSEEGLVGQEERIATALPDWHAISPEAVWRAAKALTFEEKALRTLVNLTLVEPEIGDGVWMRLGLRPYPGGFARGDEEEGYANPEGLLYAAPGKEGLLLLHHLIKQGLIVEGSDHSGQDTSLYITPEGYATADRVQAGRSEEVRRAFMVCRFIPDMDAIFENVYKPAGEHGDVRCPIQRVMDVHHVDQITDKIVRMIQEATIVVVDLTEQNFNVAFEAGYALALGKPIVWAQRMDEGDFRPPFDIQSQNILRWDPNDLPKFAEDVRFRLRAALDKAKDLS